MKTNQTRNNVTMLAILAVGTIIAHLLAGWYMPSPQGMNIRFFILFWGFLGFLPALGFETVRYTLQVSRDSKEWRNRLDRYEQLRRESDAHEREWRQQDAEFEERERQFEAEWVRYRELEANLNTLVQAYRRSPNNFARDQVLRQAVLLQQFATTAQSESVRTVCTSLAQAAFTLVAFGQGPSN